jgi:hypothetical protein
VSDAPKICRDCDHLNPMNCACLRLWDQGHIDLVQGEWVVDERDPHVERFWPWLCGKNGRHWTPRVKS